MLNQEMKVKIKQLFQVMLLLLTMIVMLTLPAYAISKSSNTAVNSEQHAKQHEIKR